MTEAEVIQRLEATGMKARRIIDFFENGHVQAARENEARALFRELKEELQGEYKRMATIRGQARLSSVEEAFYKPAIDDAWANTALSSVRWTSRPDRRWYDALWSVDDYMGYWRGSLTRSMTSNA